MTSAEAIARYEAYYIERFKNNVALKESELAVAKDHLRVALEQQARGELITGRRPR